ncbi:MAG: tRNA lysidine(34) synthetase, partial [Aestuariivirgaceae bacterium]
MPVADQVDAALDVCEADALFASLSGYSHLIVAVSGGPDSVALMRLMSGWAGRCASAPELTVVTVDHGLRAASGEEAAQVGRWAGALGLAHQILRWAGPKPQTGLQAAAREARYRLMSQWCLENDAQGIVTAHSANDQA